MRFFLNSIRKIVIRVTSSKRYQNVRSDLTILGPFANVKLTLCVSWDSLSVSFYLHELIKESSLPLKHSLGYPKPIILLVTRIC